MPDQLPEGSHAVELAAAISRVADSLERTAREVRQVATKVPRVGTVDYLTFAALADEVVRTVMWGQANLGLEAVAMKAADAHTVHLTLSLEAARRDWATLRAGLMAALRLDPQRRPAPTVQEMVNQMLSERATGDQPGIVLSERVDDLGGSVTPGGIDPR